MLEWFVRCVECGTTVDDDSVARAVIRHPVEILLELAIPLWMGEDGCHTSGSEAEESFVEVERQAVVGRFDQQIGSVPAEPEADRLGEQTGAVVKKRV